MSKRLASIPAIAILLFTGTSAQSAELVDVSTTTVAGIPVQMVRIRDGDRECEHQPVITEVIVGPGEQRSVSITMIEKCLIVLNTEKTGEAPLHE